MITRQIAVANVSKQITGTIAGLLPSAALALVMMVVPAILRFCARLAGLVTKTHIELFTQDAFFLFQLIQVFLIRTISDTASAALVSMVRSLRGSLGSYLRLCPRLLTSTFLTLLLRGWQLVWML